MSDLIKVRRENGKVVAERIINNMDHEEIISYARKEYNPTMNYKQYGFEKPICGIGCGERCAFPTDDSNLFYGYSENGLVMICTHLEDAESYGMRLYLQYDDEEDGWTEEVINFIKK